MRTSCRAHEFLALDQESALLLRFDTGFAHRCHLGPEMTSWYLGCIMSLIGVAEAKQRFSELLDRVGKGEHIVVARRGRPAVVFIPPEHAASRTSSMQAPLGFATIAGALADLAEIDDVVAEVNDARRGARDRSVPDLE